MKTLTILFLATTFVHVVVGGPYVPCPAGAPTDSVNPVSATEGNQNDPSIAGFTDNEDLLRFNTIITSFPSLSTFGLTDTAFALVYTYVHSTRDQEIMLEVYPDATDLSIRAEAQVNIFTDNNQIKPDVVTIPGTPYVMVSWTSNNQGGPNKNIYGRLYEYSSTGPTLVPLSGEVSLGASTVGDQDTTSLCWIRDDMVVVVYTSASAGDRNILMRVVSVGNLGIVELHSSILLVNTDALFDQNVPACELMDDGRVLFAWQSLGAHSGDAKPAIGRIITVLDDGTISNNTELTTSDFRLNSDTSFKKTGVQLARLANGDMFAAWELKDGYPDPDIVGRRFDAEMNGLTSDFPISDSVNNTHDEPYIVALPDGGYFLAWETGGSDLDIYYKRFAADDTEMSEDTLMNTFSPSDQRSVTMSLLNRGDMVVAAFVDTGNEDGDGLGIFVNMICFDIVLPEGSDAAVPGNGSIDGVTGDRRDALYWFDATDMSTLDMDSSGNVNEWRDKSLNNLHLFPKNGFENARPQLYSHASNDLRSPALYFDGNKRMTTNESIQLFESETAGATFIFATKPFYVGSQSFFMTWGGETLLCIATVELGIATNGDSGSVGAHRGCFKSALTPQDVAPAYDWQIITFIIPESGDPVRIFVNGTEQSVSVAGDGFIQSGSLPTDFSPLNIGYRNDAERGSGDTHGFYNSHYHGVIGEIIAFSVELNDENRTSVESYLWSKFIERPEEFAPCGDASTEGLLLRSTNSTTEFMVDGVERWNVTGYGADITVEVHDVDVGSGLVSPQSGSAIGLNGNASLLHILTSSGDPCYTYPQGFEQTGPYLTLQVELYPLHDDVSGPGYEILLSNVDGSDFLNEMGWFVSRKNNGGLFVGIQASRLQGRWTESRSMMGGLVPSNQWSMVTVIFDLLDGRVESVCVNGHEVGMTVIHNAQTPLNLLVSGPSVSDRVITVGGVRRVNGNRFFGYVGGVRYLYGEAPEHGECDCAEQFERDASDGFRCVFAGTGDTEHLYANSAHQIMADFPEHATDGRKWFKTPSSPQAFQTTVEYDVTGEWMLVAAVNQTHSGDVVVSGSPDVASDLSAAHSYGANPLFFDRDLGPVPEIRLSWNFDSVDSDLNRSGWAAFQRVGGFSGSTLASYFRDIGNGPPTMSTWNSIATSDLSGMAVVDWKVIVDGSRYLALMDDEWVGDTLSFGGTFSDGNPWSNECGIGNLPESTCAGGHMPYVVRVWIK